jgi:hypothetical protein
MQSNEQVLEQIDLALNHLVVELDDEVGLITLADYLLDIDASMGGETVLGQIALEIQAAITELLLAKKIIVD